MIGDAGKYEAQIRLGIDVVELCWPDEAENRGRTLTTRISPSAAAIEVVVRHGAMTIAARR